MRFTFLLLLSVLVITSSCSSLNIPNSNGSCNKQVVSAAVKKYFGKIINPEYRILNTKYFGLGVEKLGNLRLHLYTVEIADEADGAVMVLFVDEKKCDVHDVHFGTHALGL